MTIANESIVGRLGDGPRVREFPTAKSGMAAGLTSVRVLSISFLSDSRKLFAVNENEEWIGELSTMRGLARYAEHNANFVLIVSGSLETQRTKKFIEIVYDLLIKAIELSSLVLGEFGVRPVGLK